MFKKLSVILAISSLAACATSPTGRNQLIFMPDTQMNQMGLQAFDQMKKEKPISSDGQFNQTAQCIVTELTRGMGQNWEVVVFEDKTLNAFALPGAKSAFTPA